MINKITLPRYYFIDSIMVYYHWGTHLLSSQSTVFPPYNNKRFDQFSLGLAGCAEDLDAFICSFKPIVYHRALKVVSDVKRLVKCRTDELLRGRLNCGSFLPTRH